MARQRFIWPDLWDDPVLGRLKPVEILFFVGCFSNADDEGRLLGDPAYLRKTIFPYQDFTVQKVQLIRDTVVHTLNGLELYSVSGQEYLALTRWKEWQKPKYPTPSKIPPYTAEGFPEASPSLPPTLTEDSSTGRDGLSRVGMGRDGSSPNGLLAARVTEALRDLDPLLDSQDEQRIAKLLTAYPALDHYAEAVRCSDWHRDKPPKDPVRAYGNWLAKAKPPPRGDLTGSSSDHLPWLTGAE